MATKTAGMDKLKDLGGELLHNLGGKALETMNDRVTSLTEKLEGIGNGGGEEGDDGGSVTGSAATEAGKAIVQGDNPIMGGLKGAASGIKDKITGGSGKGGKGSSKKPVNIYETIDVGVPLKVAYNQWTEYEAFTNFTRKVHKATAQQEESAETKWGAKIFLSSREWTSTTMKQIPDERIVWESEGPKGYPNGSVTFHELSPTMTRIVLVIEYYPKGLFEKTGNIWRAQGRRVRSDFKQFPRHVMTRTILHADEVEGWRGRIEDGEVVETHEEALEREEQEAQEQEESQQDEGTFEDSEEEYEDAPEDEFDEDEAEADDSEDGDEVEEDDQAEYEEDDEAEDEAEEEPEEEPEAEPEAPRRRRRRKAS